MCQPKISLALRQKKGLIPLVVPERQYNDALHELSVRAKLKYEKSFAALHNYYLASCMLGRFSKNIQHSSRLFMHSSQTHER